MDAWRGWNGMAVKAGLLEERFFEENALGNSHSGRMTASVFLFHSFP
jgi:hypothetical protein